MWLVSLNDWNVTLINLCVKSHMCLVITILDGEAPEGSLSLIHHQTGLYFVNHWFILRKDTTASMRSGQPEFVGSEVKWIITFILPGLVPLRCLLPSSLAALSQEGTVNEAALLGQHYLRILTCAKLSLPLLPGLDCECWLGELSESRLWAQFTHYLVAWPLSHLAEDWTHYADEPLCGPSLR